MTDSHKHYFAKNVAVNAIYESSYVCEISSEEIDWKPLVTVYVFSLTEEVTEKKQILTTFYCPKGRGLNSAVCRIGNVSGWIFDVENDITLTVYSESEKGAQEGVAYLPADISRLNDDKRDIYAFEMPSDKWQAEEGTIYMGGIMNYAIVDHSQDTDWEMYFFYEQANSSIYEKIIKLK